MSRPTEHTPGTISWVDLGTPDLDAAIDFYGRVFGWTVERGPAEFGGYSTATRDGARVAGLMPLMAEGQPSVWTVYLATDDADRTARQVREGGGQLIAEPMDVADQGRMLVGSDPTGAVFGAWQPGTHTGFGMVDEPGSTCWFELVSRDRAKADAFYGSLFPYTFEQIGDGESFDYTVLRIGESYVGGSTPMGPDQAADISPQWMVHFAVEDTDAVAALVAQLGGGVDLAPTDSPHGRFAAVHDPWGARFTVMVPAESA